MFNNDFSTSVGTGLELQSNCFVIFMCVMKSSTMNVLNPFTLFRWWYTRTVLFYFFIYFFAQWHVAASEVTSLVSCSGSDC